MIEVLDQTRTRVAVLQNAFDVTEKRRINSVWEMQFSIPANDPKASYCIPRNFVRYNDGELYRILDYDTSQDGMETLTFSCEHVIATLIDHLLFRDHERVGFTTAQNIRYILSFQSDWQLAACDFSLRYDYAWSSENLLTALWSIPGPFTDYYQFTFDTSSYPWKLSLKKIDQTQKPQFYVFSGFNYLRGKKTTYSSEVVTRLYCLGYGEGVNQLTISGINNGLPYIQNDAAIAEYGVIEAVFVDRKYEDAQSLMAAGQAILAASSTPRVEYELEVADLYKITRNDYHKAELGRVVKFVDDNYITYVTEIERNHGTDEMKIAVANAPEDLASAIADLADRQRIESTYAQGATQVWAAPFANNADVQNPLVYDLWIPSNLRIMNEVKVKIKLERFRAYTKSSEAAGKTASTSGPSSTNTTGYTQDAQLSLTQETGTQIGFDTNHYHEYWPNLVEHNHNMEHTHTFEIPSHTHEITPGIYRLGDAPTGAVVALGNGWYTFDGTTDERDVTQYLIGQDGKIPRGTFIPISVTPTGPGNGLAYVVVSVAAVGFIQSKTGGNY